MTEQDLKILLSKGERISTEIKTAKNSPPQNVFETICAFLKIPL